MFVQQLLKKLYPGATPKDVRALMRMARGKHELVQFVFTPQRIDQIKAAFMAIDGDRSGELNEEEFVEFLAGVGKCVFILPCVKEVCS